VDCFYNYRISLAFLQDSKKSNRLFILSSRQNWTVWRILPLTSIFILKKWNWSYISNLARLIANIDWISYAVYLSCDWALDAQNNWWIGKNRFQKNVLSFEPVLFINS
jgi:hypothetical protein